MNEFIQNYVRASLILRIFQLALTKDIILVLKFTMHSYKNASTDLDHDTITKVRFRIYYNNLNCRAVFYLRINYACYFTYGLDSCFIYFSNVFLKRNKHLFLADKKLKAVKYISRTLKR